MQTANSEKPALVFLHYFGGAALSWQWVTDQLEPAYRCFVPDLPGFGGRPPLQEISLEHMARWVMEETRREGIGSYTLIGHSIGGKIAVQMAALDTAGAIRQLILVAPSPPSIEPIPEAEKKRMLVQPDRNQAEATVAKITRKPLTKSQYNLAITTQLIADHNTWAWWIQQGTVHSLEDQLPAVRVPVTVLASEDDPSMNISLIRDQVIGLLPQARLVTTREVGHLSPMEAPDWIVTNILQAVTIPAKNLEA